MKNIERYLISLFLIFFLGSSIFISKVNAFDAPRIYIKELNINKTIFKSGESISGDFLMWNTTDGIVTDLDYKISLIKDHQVFGEKIFPVSSQIYSNGTYRQNFLYAVPENIASGGYIMFVRLYTKTGMPLNWEQKDITVNGNNNLLIISGSKLMRGDSEFQPMVGVNFDSKEYPPVAVFGASNPSSKSIEFDLRVTIYNVQSNMKELESFSVEKGILGPGKKKDFLITLPKYETAGTYLAKISFLSKNILVSNEESFRWVIKGQSARILKVKSSEDFFQKGKTAKVTVDIAGPADASFLKGVKLGVSIFDKDGKVLAFSEREIGLGGGVTSEVFDLRPNADAISPKIEVKISKDGKELDSYKTEIKSANTGGNSTGPIQPTKDDNFWLIFFVLVFLLVILLIAIAIIKFVKGKKLVMLLLLAILFAVGLVGFFGLKTNPHFVNALDFDNLAVVWNKPLPKSIHNFGSPITFEGDVNVTDCVNMVSSLKVSSYICDQNQNEASCVSTGDFLSIVPKGIVYLKEGAIGYYYVLDGGGRVIKYNASTKAYVNEYGSVGSGVGNFKSPNSIFYSSPYIYVADTNNDRIVRFDPSNFAGTWKAFGVNGSGEGQFTYPVSVFYDASTEFAGSGSGYIYVVERGSNNRVVRFKLDNAGSLVVGTWQTFGSGCGYGVGCFQIPGAVFYDSGSDYVYVAGGWGSQIIRFKPGNVNGTWQKIGADTLTKIEVVNGGSGYTSAPTVAITGGGATTNATAHAVLDGTTVKEVVVDTGGWGYTRAPNVTLSGGGGGSGAIVTANFRGTFRGYGVGEFINPKGIYYDSPSDYIYVSGGDGSVVKVKAGSNMIDGDTSRVNPVTDWTDLGSYGFGIGKFNLTRGAIYDSVTGNVYVADEGNYRIVKFDPNDINTTNSAWDEIDFTGPITTLDFFPYRINTTVPAKSVFDTIPGFDMGANTVTGFIITNPGSGYTSNPGMTFSGGGGGSGAVANAVFDPGSGTITGYNITNPGSGYSSVPTVVIDPPASGIQATATAIVGSKAYAKVVVDVIDNSNILHSVNSSAPIFIVPPPPTYTISGNVFNDTNKSKVKDGGEINYPAVPVITVSPAAGTINALADGTYTISNLPAGTYIVSYTSLPAGYSVWPSPANLQVTVGPGCNVVDPSTGGSCAGDNAISLNFAINNSMPWIQTYGLDLRVDDGFANPQPVSTVCGGGSYASGTTGAFTRPGIVFSGDSSSDFGQGFSSNMDWVVGGMSYPEVFQSATPLKISTQSLRAAAQKAGIPLNSLSSVAGCSDPATDCNLPNGLAKGIYVTNGDIRFRQQFNTTFTAGNTYIFIAENNGTIFFENNARVIVPGGAIVFFAAGHDLVIDPTIQAPTNTCPVPAGQIQGILSADHDIIIEGNNGNCALGADNMLNLEGTLIANAARVNGTFQNHRDLCGDNPTYPSLTIKARPDFILNTPGFLIEQNTISHEEAP